MELAGYIGKDGVPQLLRGHWLATESPDRWKRTHRFPEAGVWYDEDEQHLHFLTDRFGFSHLYIYEVAGAVAWCSDPSLLSEVVASSLTLNSEAAFAMVRCGFLPGNMTWFKEVELLPAAAHWVYNLITNTWTKNRYWSWLDMPGLDMSFDEAVDELAERLRSSMRSALVSQEGRIGISLSGGLDSRLLLTLATEVSDPVTYTFGLPDSWDVRIARRVAERAGVAHHVLELSKKNWWDGREAAVIRSAGMANVMHLHHVPNAERNAGLADVNLNGFSGDIFFRGFSGSRAGRVDQREASQRLGEFGERFPPDASWYGESHTDAYWIDQHVRRFTRAAVMEWEHSLSQLLVFTDFELLSFLYSLPNSYRANNRLYAACLLRHFPALFRDIPWKLTGLPLGWSALTNLAIRLKVPQVIRHLALFGRYQYTDYPSWMRTAGAVDRWRQLLSPEGAYYKLVGVDWERKYLLPFLARKRGGEEMLSRVLTIAIWLESRER